MRKDGRQADDLRPVRMTPGFNKHAEGSVLIEVGDTRVICTASVEHRVPPWLREQKRGWVTAEYGMLPRATTDRVMRESSRGKPSGRTQEIQRLIGRSLRAVVDTVRLGERTVWLDCDVIQADGGTRTAAITGAFVALALCGHKMYEKGWVNAPFLTDQVAATSVGIVGGKALLDLAYDEDSAADVDMNVVRTGAGAYVEVQGTAEADPFPRATLDQLLGLADAGIDRLLELQREVLGDGLAKLMKPRTATVR
ncbi:MAG: ribonuclease PH [Acidobacteriota bacterium]